MEHRGLVPAMKPSDAYAKMAHRQVERVVIDDLQGRVTGVLLTPYPPGIPLLIPGERFNERIVNYLRFAREFNAEFPGFDTNITGLASETGTFGVLPEWEYRREGKGGVCRCRYGGCRYQ